MDSFPDEDSIDRLKALTVRYVLVHQAFYRPTDFTDLMTAIAARPELVAAGRYRDWIGDTQIFELKREK
jgi:hypothetical protein